MRTITKVLVPLAAAGVTLAPMTTASAEAAPARQSATVAAPAFTVRWAIATRPAANQISAAGSIRDNTAGRDWVAVQAFIQRRDGNRWVTVVNGPRRVGNNVATSGIGWRRCTNGKVYRVKVNYNWNNRQRGSIVRGLVRC